MMTFSIRGMANIIDLSGRNLNDASLNLHNQGGYREKRFRRSGWRYIMTQRECSQGKPRGKEKQFILKVSLSRTSHYCSCTVAKSGAKSPGPETAIMQYQNKRS